MFDFPANNCGLLIMVRPVKTGCFAGRPVEMGLFAGFLRGQTCLTFPATFSSEHTEQLNNQQHQLL